MACHAPRNSKPHILFDRESNFKFIIVIIYTLLEWDYNVLLILLTVNQLLLLVRISHLTNNISLTVNKVSGTHVILINWTSWICKKSKHTTNSILKQSHQLSFQPIDCDQL
jgi:hypothetical protein